MLLKTIIFNRIFLSKTFLNLLKTWEITIIGQKCQNTKDTQACKMHNNSQNINIFPSYLYIICKLLNHVAWYFNMYSSFKDTFKSFKHSSHVYNWSKVLNEYTKTQRAISCLVPTKSPQSYFIDNIFVDNFSFLFIIVIFFKKLF